MKVETKAQFFHLYLSLAKKGLRNFLIALRGISLGYNLVKDDISLSKKINKIHPQKQ